jgi:hypothetical protein
MEKELLDELKGLVMKEIMRDGHGENNAIPMIEIHERIFGPEWGDKINATRDIRHAIDALQWDGFPVASGQRGYYTAAFNGSEMDKFYRKIRKEALRKLAKISRMRRVALREEAAQLALEDALIAEYEGRKA